MAKNSKLAASILRDILPQKLSKSDLRRLDILNGAIKTYSRIDIKYVSYEDIGREAKASSALIQHYFPDKKDLLLIAMKLVRGQFQQLVIDSMVNEQKPLAIMEKYVRGTFRWLEVSPQHVQAWFFFLYLCGMDEGLRKTHLELTEMGQVRITEILRIGVETKVFHPKLPLPVLAKQIQKVITGGLIEVKTEAGSSALKRIEDETWELCLSLLT